MNAVITGDIIRSTQLTTASQTMLIDGLNASLQQWSKDYNMRYEIYRGDSFQCLLPNEHEALRLMLLLKTFIKSLNPNESSEASKSNNTKPGLLVPNLDFDARIALGIGNIDSNSTKLGQTNGQAFILSGHTLDELKNQKQTLAIATADSHHEELQTELILLDFIVSRMTALQSEVILWKLSGYTESYIAKQLGINQSAVNQRANSAGWNAINTLVQRFEKLYTYE